MKLYIITGEPSADLIAANLVREMNTINNNIQIRAWGGQNLLNEGVEIAKDISDISYMGFKDVILNLFEIKKNFNYCKQDIINFSPQAIILIDYPGFNLKIAKFAKKIGIKVFYYVPPKIWAWNKQRLSKLKKYVDHIIVIFPFEVDFYKKNFVDVHYFGNPLLDQVHKKNNPLIFKYNKPVIALLPGSRRQEIKSILPRMLSVVKKFDNYQFVISGLSHLKKYYNKCNTKEIPIVYDNNRALLERADYALVTSGTATLETAIHNVPQIVCYKTNYLTYFLAKFFIKIKHISLVNILMRKEVVKELIQSDLTASNIEINLNRLFLEKEKVKVNYKKLMGKIGEKGQSKKVAKFILETI